MFDVYNGTRKSQRAKRLTQTSVAATRAITQNNLHDAFLDRRVAQGSSPSHDKMSNDPISASIL